MFITLVMIIGLVILYFEHKNKKAYNKTFDDFMCKICNNKNIKKEQKLFLVEQMFLQNGYTVSKKDGGLKAEKKLFSLGLFLLTLSLWMLYYLFIQKPHTLTFNLSDESCCNDSKSFATT